MLHNYIERQTGGVDSFHQTLPKCTYKRFPSKLLCDLNHAPMVTETKALEAP